VVAVVAVEGLVGERAPDLVSHAWARQQGVGLAQQTVEMAERGERRVY
jgi:hypothetical protein